jgi:hypothetical protein
MRIGAWDGHKEQGQRGSSPREEPACNGSTCRKSSKVAMAHSGILSPGASETNVESFVPWVLVFQPEVGGWKQVLRSLRTHRLRRSSNSILSNLGYAHILTPVYISKHNNGTC